MAEDLPMRIHIRFPGGKPPDARDFTDPVTIPGWANWPAAAEMPPDRVAGEIGRGNLAAWWDGLAELFGSRSANAQPPPGGGRGGPRRLTGSEPSLPEQVRLDRYNAAMRELRRIDPGHPHATTLTGPSYIPDQATVESIEQAVRFAQGRQGPGSSGQTALSMDAVTGRILVLPRGQAQAKFKHAQDFGIPGNWTPQRGQDFEAALRAIVRDRQTLRIVGTYRGQGVVHYFQRSTSLNVIVDPTGNFVSGWRLNDLQMLYLLKLGSL